MTLVDQSHADALTEECIEELDELILTLDRYPPTAVAVALGTLLGGLLAALLERGECAPAEARELLHEIELGALQEADPA